MSVSRRLKLYVAAVTVVVITGGAGLMLWPEPLPPYPRPRPDIQVWDASLPPPDFALQATSDKPEGIR